MWMGWHIWHVLGVWRCLLRSHRGMYGDRCLLGLVEAGGRGNLLLLLGRLLLLGWRQTGWSVVRH